MFNVKNINIKELLKVFWTLEAKMRLVLNFFTLRRRFINLKNNLLEKRYVNDSYE